MQIRPRVPRAAQEQLNQFEVQNQGMCNFLQKLFLSLWQPLQFQAPEPGRGAGHGGKGRNGWIPGDFPMGKIRVKGFIFIEKLIIFSINRIQLCQPSLSTKFINIFQTLLHPHWASSPQRLRPGVNWAWRNDKLFSKVQYSKQQQMEYKEDSIAPHIEKRFEKVEKIGSGAYGYVWKVKQRKSGKVFALKKIFLAFQNDVDAQRTFREISILKQLDHPNIIKLQEVIKAENDLDLYLVFEYIECDLFSAIRDGVLNETHKKYVVYQLAKTLVYLHSAGVLHRDLKPSNILIDSGCKIKICDFGLSRTLYHYDGEPPVMTEFIATRWYRAPEVLFGSTTYSQKSDMWSLGCLIYEIYASRSLLPGNDSVNQIQKLLEFKGFPNPKEMAQLNVDRLDVLLSHFSTQKLPQNHYFKSTWNSDLVTLLKGLLQYSPATRWSPQQVLNCQFVSQFKDFQEVLTAQKQVIVRVSDNKKHEKDFYRNFIHKIFVSKNSINLEKCFAMSQHVSRTQSKRNACTSMRKKLAHHNSNVSSLAGKIPSSKSLSKTVHATSRNASINVGRSPAAYQKPENASPYKTKLKEISRHQKSKPAHRKLHREPLREVSNSSLNSSMKSSYKNLKQTASKKNLKRKVFVYNI